VKNIIVLSLVLLLVATSHAPKGMLKDFWNMLWKKDTGYEEEDL
jgi:hypothetical protein